jgi:hypothetical protein
MEMPLTSPPAVTVATAVFEDTHVEADVTTGVVASDKVAVTTSWLVGVPAPRAVVPVIASEETVAVEVVVVVPVVVVAGLVADEPLQPMAARSSTATHTCVR